MQFRKYQHIERYGTDEVEGIEDGICVVFPKIDGTNSSVWLGDDGEIKAGSRRRELTLEKDNRGFYAYVLQDERLKNYLKKHPSHRLYGEFLVPHTLKTYRDDAWRRFYIFDVVEEYEDGSFRYLPYNEYKPLLEEFGLDYIPPIAILKNPTYENFIKLLDKTDFLIKDGAGPGEGIVIKNYDYRNKYGRQTWAKIVRSEFKEKFHKIMGAPEVKTKKVVEERIIDDFVTEAFIEKEYAKIVNEKGGWRSEYITMFFNKLFYTLIKEEMWNIVKKYKRPKIDFRRLYVMITLKVKEVKRELF